MAIITALLVTAFIAAITGIIEGGKALSARIADAVEWRRIKKRYYPKRKAGEWSYVD